MISRRDAPEFETSGRIGYGEKIQIGDEHMGSWNGCAFLRLYISPEDVILGI
jgi:hypothetical protein